MAAVRACLWVGPRPVALLLRRAFARSGRVWGAALLARAPTGVTAVLDEPYGDHPDELLDVYAPVTADPSAPRPTVVWVHGGAFVGGAKEEIAGYLRILAAAGYTVVGVRYSLAPESRYPTPVRQVLAALGHLQDNAARLGVDPTRFVLAGDSAGAQIAAQVACVVTGQVAAAPEGLTPTIGAAQLRGAVLCCGAYDLAAFAAGSPFAPLVDAVGWAYSGTRRFRDDERFVASTSVAGQVTAAFPPTFLTAGNDDPLVGQSTALADVLRALGVEVDALFFPPDHEPPLEHEYQFHFDRDDAATALERLLAFLARCTDPSS